jgi:hypothetical protein
MHAPRTHVRRPRALASVLALLVAGASAVAWAGGNTQFRNPANLSQVIDKLWDDRSQPVEWVMSNDGLPGSGITNTALQAELQAAFDAWEALPTSRLDFTFGGQVPLRNAGGDGVLGPGIDGRNLVTFTDPDFTFPTGVLAVAITFSFPTDTVITSANNDLDGDGTADLPVGTYPAGRIFDGDLVFNSSEPWSTGGANGSIDVRAVALHEVGHFVGLCHSMIRDAVMWPFLANDVIGARLPKPDDVAWGSRFYPAEPAFSAAFGAIRGRVTNGLSGLPVLGAHVFAVDPLTGTRLVGGYTGDDGSYVLPGLPPGSYLVGIEPLDGDPVGLDPFRVNEVVLFTFDTSFPEELFDANEAAVEADPLAGEAVTVAAGADTTAIDLVTNTLEVPGVSRLLDTGYNLFAYPVTVPADLGAFDLLTALGAPGEVHAVDRYVPATGTFERAEYVDGSPAGVDFPIRRGEGYVVHTAGERIVSFAGGTDCPPLDLRRGMNLIGVPCPPAGYTAFALLQDLGEPFEVLSVERFDPESGAFERAAYDAGGAASGDDFPVANGEGYVVTMLADKAGVRIPAPGQSFAPIITGLSPGRGVPGTVVLVLGGNFDPDPAKNTVTFNGVGAGVVFATATTLTVTVPAVATSGPVRVTVGGKPSNTVDFVVEPALVSETPGEATELVSGQTAEGVIAVDGQQDRYTFTALEGSVVTVKAESVTPGVPNLVLLLEDPFGLIVATDDNGGGGTNPRINNFVLTTTGTHTIVVTNVPGSGTGPYRVTLTIATRSTSPKVSVLSGDFQTALKGTTLPTPLSVFVTGTTGAPVAGVPVVFVADEATVSGSRLGPNAGTIVLTTNASGVATVQVTVPNAAGAYQVTVIVNGAAPATVNLAATNNPLGTVTGSPMSQQGVVNQALPAKLQVLVKDGAGNPLPNAMVAYLVASGGGSVTGATGSGTTLTEVTDATGKAEVTFTLGKKTSDAQVVAAFVPGMSRPLLFEGTPKAGNPKTLRSNRSSFNRMTLGTVVLNGLSVEVLDEFDNPVPGTPVTYNGPAELTIEPGLGPNGVMFTDLNTNADGIHVAMVTAGTDVVPTVDEFGGLVGAVHSITASAGTGSETFEVHIDMGPVQVTAAGTNAAALIGQALPGPIAKRVLRWQRKDEFVDANGDGKDDDNCEFGDEPFDGPKVQKGIQGVSITFEVRREDGKDPAPFQPTRTAAPSATTSAAGEASVGVTLSDVGGVSQVVGKIALIHVEWKAEGNPGCDGSVLYTQPFTDGRSFAESTTVFAIPVVLTATLADARAGIDFSSIRAALNAQVFFNGAAPPAAPPDFPEKLEVTAGGRVLKTIDGSIPAGSAFPTLKIEYHPARPKLAGSNTFLVSTLKDRIENEHPGASTTFSYP